MELIIERLNGERFDLECIGIKTLDFTIASLSPKHDTEEIEQIDGVIDLGTTFEPRIINASFYFESVGLLDYVRMRNVVFNIFQMKEQVYIIDKREPYKRWKVKMNSAFSPSQIGKYGFYDAEFVAFYPYAESPGTTLNMDGFDSYFSIGAGKIYEGDPIIQYSFTENGISVFNDSDIVVNPRNMDLKITLKGNLNSPIIRNLTTGDEWSYAGTATANDEIVLDGIKSLKNGQSIFGQTNHKLITLVPGWNEFEITGASDFIISFDFRFYYL